MSYQLIPYAQTGKTIHVVGGVSIVGQTLLATRRALNAAESSRSIIAFLEAGTLVVGVRALALERRIELLQ